ncbi:MAG TPA: GAF domain-containing protein [Gaiellaceae bacterium]
MTVERKRGSAKKNPTPRQRGATAQPAPASQGAGLTLSWEYRLDSQGVVVQVSPACKRLSGYSEDEFLADPKLMERIVHPDDRPRFEQHVAHSHAAGRFAEGDIEFRIVARDGGEHWIAHTCTAMTDPDGHYLGRAACNIDISRYKLAEETLLRLNRELIAGRECARATLRATSEERLLRDICRIVCNSGGYLMAWVGLVERDENKTVRPVAWSGVEDGYLSSAKITWADSERGRGPTETAARTGETVVLDDYASDPTGQPWRARAFQRGYRSSIAIPLRGSGGEVFAVLTIYADRAHAFTRRTVGLLEELAEDLSFGIESLRARSERDPA